MQIDWITVTAQIVNFLILVYLLKRFLYAPVMRAMDRRERRVTDRLKEAEEREREAEENAREYREKTEELERKRDEMLGEAREEAERDKRRLLDEAREEIAETRKRWQQQVSREKADFLANLRQRTGDAVQSVARKALADLADAELEAEIVRSFVDRLKSLDEEAREAFGRADGPIRVNTAFELDSGARGRLTRALHEHLAEGAEVDYGESEGLVCGIELAAGGRRLGWSLADYLDELSERVEQALAENQVRE